MRYALALMLVLLPAATALAADPWPHLDRTSMGADAFVLAHPEWDGRGVAIAVVDSGVDLGIPGLSTTSAGELKVVEARDFTGQGDVDLEELEWHQGVPVHPDGWTVTGLDRLGVDPRADDVLIGMIDEGKLAGSRAQDLDGDGHTDGRWAVACIGFDDGWRLWVDVNGNGDLSDEEALQDYGIGHRVFALAPGGTKGRTPLVLAPTILWREKILSLHFDDGGHGTHVAGIAAGHSLGGIDGQDGIAPGAQVLSLKIGHNQLPGGATVTGSMKKAFEHGARWSEEHGVPVVFNLSYGISSGLEDDAGMESFLDQLLVEHPQLAIVTSAGNEGPGLSTIGIPAGARHVIAVGSYFTRELASNLRGRDIAAARVVYYSSRGGELDRPDVVAPGLAYSTVARWDDRPVKSGTSMASPEVAGAVALLLSGARASGLSPSWEDVRRALWDSAKPVAGYGPLDQGAGLVQVPGAWDTLRALASRRGVRPLTFDVDVDSPVPPGYAGRTAYWRAGGYVPDRRKGVRFDVIPVFAERVTADQRVSVTVDVNLRSDAAWLKTDRARVQFQGEQERTLAVRFDPARLTSPGVHVGQVIGTPVGESAPVFKLTAVVVVPHRFDGPGERQRSWSDITLKPGDVRRLFLDVPPGATAMEARVAIPEGRDGKLWLDIYDPTGDPDGRQEGRADSEGDREAIVRVDRDELIPGTWELDLIGAHDGVTAIRARVDVRFFGLEATPPTITALTGGASKPASGEVQLINRFDRPFEGSASGTLDRLERTRDLEADPQGWTESFELTADRPRGRFEFVFDPAEYSDTTDIALRILRGGEPVARGGVGPDGGSVQVSGAGSYTVELTAAHWDDGREDPIPFSVTDSFFLASPATVTVTDGGDGDLALYPGLTAPLTIEVDGTLPHTGDGFEAAGEVTFVDPDDESEWLVLPLKIP